MADVAPFVVAGALLGSVAGMWLRVVALGRLTDRDARIRAEWRERHGLPPA